MYFEVMRDGFKTLIGTDPSAHGGKRTKCNIYIDRFNAGNGIKDAKCNKSAGSLEKTGRYPPASREMLHKIF